LACRGSQHITSSGRATGQLSSGSNDPSTRPAPSKVRENQLANTLNLTVSGQCARTIPFGGSSAINNTPLLATLGGPDPKPIEVVPPVAGAFEPTNGGLHGDQPKIVGSHQPAHAGTLPNTPHTRRRPVALLSLCSSSTMSSQQQSLVPVATFYELSSTSTIMRALLTL